MRSQTQTSYQILVASTRELLATNRGDLWNTGIVNSDQTLGIPYGGKKLQFGMNCFWKIKVWDMETRASQWSAVARISVGPLSPSDWKANWIGMESANDSECPWFRKEFEVTKLPTDALAYVASVGFHELYINGKKVDDRVLAPSVSDLGKRIPFVTYNIRPYLVTGKNVVGIWLAPGWSHFTDGNPDKVSFGTVKAPLVIAQLKLSGSSVGSSPIGTDATWQCARSSTRHLGRWQNSDFGGDAVDGYRDSLAWCTAASSSPEIVWERATIYPSNRILSSDAVEPNRRCDKIDASEIKLVAPGKYRIKMNRLFTGWIDAKLHANPGSKVTLHASSLPDREVEYNETDEYIVGPSGTGRFCNRFSYHEIQYITIEGVDTPPVFDDVSGYRISNDRARIGRFNCSNPLLQRIYETTLNTYLNLSTGAMTVDCPHRERLGYGGDGHTSMEIAMDTFSSDLFFSQWAQDWCDIQLGDGRIYHTAPTKGGGGGPAWSGFILTMPWEVYVATGDTRILENTLPSALRWLDYLQAYVGADGLIQPLPGGYWMFLGDWVTPHGSEGADTPEALLFNNCYCLYVTRIAGRIAHILGQDAEADRCKECADKLKLAINKSFFKSSSALYLDSRETHIVLPLVADIVPIERLADVKTNLEHEILINQKGHLDTGLHGTYFLTHYLTEADRSDLVFTYATQTTFPGYGDLLLKGYETWPEEWNGSDSRVHGCLNGIGGWFQRGLAGIRADSTAPGYKHTIIKPAIVGDLSWVNCYHDSPYGRVVSNWHIEDKKVAIDIEIPANCSATVYVPTSNTTSVRESGKTIKKSAGTRFLRTEPGYGVFEIGAGMYHFAATR